MSARDPSPRPRVVALVGSPRRHGNTVVAVTVATAELERLGVACETVMLCDVPLSLGDPEEERERRPEAQHELEALLDAVWSADGVILASPIYFANVSAQMKAFMDATNDRYLAGRWLAPRVVGLMAIGAQGGFTATVQALSAYLNLIAPGHPPVVTATGHADALGEAGRSAEITASARRMAQEMVQILRPQDEG